MTASKTDRAHVARIGAIKDASHSEALRLHRSLPIAERLRRSWALHCAYRETVQARQQDDATPFYDRARSLGLYRP